MANRQSFIIIFLILLVSGCAGTSDHAYRSINKRRAKEAWKVALDEHPNVNFSRHYADGWKEGYFEISTGSDGTPPVVPPKQYWSTKYQNPTGQRVVEEWYRGYQDGTMRAEQDGRRLWHSVPSMAPHLEMLPSVNVIETSVES